MQNACDSKPMGDDPFILIGTYSYNDAKLLLDNFTEGNIRFSFSENAMAMKNMPPVLAAYGGTFGQGSGTAIFVHPDDVERALEMQQLAFEIEASVDHEEKPTTESMDFEEDYPRCPKCASVEILYDSFSYHHSAMHFLIAFMPWKWKYKKWYCRKCWHIWESGAK